MNDQNGGTRFCGECGSDYNPDTCVLARCPAFQEDGVPKVTRKKCTVCEEEKGVGEDCEHPLCPSTSHPTNGPSVGPEKVVMTDGDPMFFFRSPPNFGAPDFKLSYEEVDHPDHYNKHPSGVECINIIEHMSFNLGSAVKYIWRNGLKPGQDWKKELKKAIWYIEREIERIEGEVNGFEEGE